MTIPAGSVRRAILILLGMTGATGLTCGLVKGLESSVTLKTLHHSDTVPGLVPLLVNLRGFHLVTLTTGHPLFPRGKLRMSYRGFIFRRRSRRLLRSAGQNQSRNAHQEDYPSLHLLPPYLQNLRGSLRSPLDLTRL